jgi:Na+-transporting NADH:ubiquinone oxidoreductase subunit C
MAKERKPFIETNLYPIVFMILLTIVFVGVLAVIYHLNLDKIKVNKEIQYQATMTGLFTGKLSTSGTPSEIFKQHFTEQKDSFGTYYEVRDKDAIIGYCFIIKGQGLWGSMQAMLAVTPDFQKIINLDVYQHLETPGLGGRIEESWFKNQFTDKTIMQGSSVLQYTLIPEKSSPVADNQMMQITGATRTSEGVAKMLFSEMEKIVRDFPKQSEGGISHD